MGECLHKIAPVEFGGPIFEGVNEIFGMANAGRTSRMGRFVSYLKSQATADLRLVVRTLPLRAPHHHLKSLYTEPQLMKHILQVWRDDSASRKMFR
jgi:hypothetical protein